MSNSRSWPGYAAASWALLFAALSFYWAAGGRLGEGTIGLAVETPALAREASFVAILWASAVVKLLGGLIGFALSGQVFSWLGRRLTLLAGWTIAALLLLYGAANLVQHLLIATRLIAMPSGLGWRALPWHLLLWDPVWLMGGVLFGLATFGYLRQGRSVVAHHQ